MKFPISNFQFPIKEKGLPSTTFHRKDGAGFTLIELLIVIAIVVILASIVIIAINPMRQIALANNTRRKVDINSISKAITQNIIDNQGFFFCAAGDIPLVPTIMGSGAGQYDICDCLVPTYLAAMPSDPQHGYYNDCTDYNTEYTIQEVTSLLLRAPHTQIISDLQEDIISFIVPGEIIVKTPPSFSLIVNPFSGSVIAGNSTSTNLTATPIEGFNQPVTFSASIDPSEPTISLSFSPANNCTPTCSLTLNISTGPATPIGSYSIIITGTGGEMTKQTTFTLTVVSSPPTAPSSLAGNAFCAGSNDPDISLSWQDNSNNEEGFKLYRGPSSDFTPIDPPLATLAANVTSYTDITPLSTTTYYYKIKAFNAGGDSAFASSPAITTDSCVPTFVLIPSLATINIGQTQQFDGEYDPDGPGGSALPFIVDRATVTWSSSDISIATINSTGLATGEGGGSVIISGVYSGITATANLTVTAAFDFSLSVSPNSGSVSQGNSVSSTVTATLISGVSQSVSFSVSGLPAGAVVSFSPNSCNPSCSSTMTISTGPTTPVGNYSVIITGTSGGLNRTTTYDLIVTSPAVPIWQSCESGSLTCNVPWNYSMGYKFTPTQNGQVSGLCGFFSGTKWVRLYNSAYSVLASAQITSSNNWVCSSITPVNVTAGSVYYVVVETAGSGVCYRNILPDAFPKTCNTVTINVSVYQFPSGTFNAGHSDAWASVMYGMVDIIFSQ